jgi:hypothetical protein
MTRLKAIGNISTLEDLRTPVKRRKDVSAGRVR